MDILDTPTPPVPDGTTPTEKVNLNELVERVETGQFKTITPDEVTQVIAQLHGERKTFLETGKSTTSSASKRGRKAKPINPEEQALFAALEESL